MALVYLDSCGDAYATAHIVDRWDTVSGSPTVGASIGRRAGGGINLPSTGEILQKDYPALTSYVVGMACKVTSLVATDLLTFREGSGDHIIVRLKNLGEIEVLRAPSTSLFTTASGIVQAGAFFYLEASITIDGASGVVNIDVNGTNRINETSVNTQNGGTAVTDNIQVKGSTANLTIDDFYILDTTGSSPQNVKLGDTQINTVLPQAEGATNNWPTLFPTTPTTSFDKVDDATPDDDATYVASDIVGNEEFFDMNDLPDPGGVSAIYGVQIGLHCRRDQDAALSIRSRLTSGSADVDGTTQALPQAYAYLFELYDEDPDTNADWLGVAINAAEFGAEVQ